MSNQTVKCQPRAPNLDPIALEPPSFPTSPAPRPPWAWTSKLFSHPLAAYEGHGESNHSVQGTQHAALFPATLRMPFRQDKLASFDPTQNRYAANHATAGHNVTPSRTKSRQATHPPAFYQLAETWKATPMRQLVNFFDDDSGSWRAPGQRNGDWPG
jgi:hypothetical protein